MPKIHVENSHDVIRVIGARENNLQNISLDIPKRKITVFTGVSGSGKSSLVFDTIAAEAQRQLNDTFTAFAQGFLPQFDQPDVDAVENLNAPILIDQKRVGGGTRSTLGTFTDTAILLRRLFASAGQPSLGSASAFSFNTPQGMCLECEGLGQTAQVDLEAFLDRTKSLNGGAILHPDFMVGKFLWKLYPQSGLFDNDKPLSRYTKREWDVLLFATGVDTKTTIGEMSYKFEGLVERFERLYIKRERGDLSERNKAIAARYMTTQTCPVCNGSRLNQAALACRVEGYNIAQLSTMEIGELAQVLSKFREPKMLPGAAKLGQRLQQIVNIGLGYLTLNRETATLSGGESQRLKMVRHLGNNLVDMLYVLDEPSVGLHASDVEKLGVLLRDLRDKGNTVLVVEHDPDVIAIADHIVDVGPRAGVHGGKVVYQGNLAGLLKSNTLTGKCLESSAPVKATSHKSTGHLSVRGATLHNLKKLDVDIPTGVLTVVTGVAGSGKSSLITDVFVSQYPDTVLIDQSPVTTSVRSVPATYTGIMDELRQAFAKANGVNPSLFSFNSAGSCQSCNGLGLIYTDYTSMAGVTSKCDACEGKRFKPEVLRYMLRGKSIGDVLNTTLEDALTFFTEPKILPMVKSMCDVGLGYLTLGQPLSTLSGGEGQRLKLATELHKVGTVYVMDEPTTGLHLSDITLLMKIIDRMVGAGNTVIVIEHHLDVIRQADWVIEMGPGGGSAGGNVVFAGTPRALLKSQKSVTAKYLNRDTSLKGQA